MPRRLSGKLASGKTTLLKKEKWVRHGQKGDGKKRCGKFAGMEGPWDTKDKTALGEDHQAAINNSYINKGDMVDQDLVPEEEKKKILVDYCKRSTTKCRQCRIQKDDLRIGKSAI